jgi:hypothetical protein
MDKSTVLSKEMIDKRLKHQSLQVTVDRFLNKNHYKQITEEVYNFLLDYVVPQCNISIDCLYETELTYATMKYEKLKNSYNGTYEEYLGEHLDSIKSLYYKSLNKN